MQDYNCMKNLFTQYPDSVLIVNRYDEVLYANPSAVRFLCRIKNTGGYLPAVLQVLEGRYPAVSMHDLVGEEIVLEINCAAVSYSGQPAKLLVMSDRTATVCRQRELERLVYHDELTGLCNRRGLECQISPLIAHAKRLQQTVNAYFIDVNNLKKINDSLGHSVGDEALLETSEVIRQGFGDDAICARIGGDEFAVFQLVNPERSFQDVIECIELRLAELNKRKDRAFCLSLSIGMSQYTPAETFSLKKLLQLADTNMYRAKNKCEVVQVSKKRGNLQRNYVRIEFAFMENKLDIDGVCA